MFTSKENSRLVASGAGVSASRRHALGLTAAVMLIHLPLFLVHLRNLWMLRPHYQFFPLLLVGIGWLLWIRWPQWTANVSGPWWFNLLLATGLGTLAVAAVIFSPWLGAVAMVLSVGGLIGRYATPGQWREWLPVWLLMWLIVPPPLRLDYQLISWLQSSTSRMASCLLDLLGILHLMEGHVLVLPGHRMLVDEACSGVNSVLVLLVLTALFVVWARRPLIWIAFLLASSVAWAWAANVVRVATVAIAQAWFDLNLSTGWQHEALGYVTILMALALLASTDYCLAFFLKPIVLRNADLSRYASRPSFLSSTWNWCMGAGYGAWRSRSRRTKPGAETSVNVPQGVISRQAATTVFREQLWLASAALIGGLQVASFMLSGPRDFDMVHLERADLPENLNGWKMAEHQLVRREVGDREGQFSSEWKYRNDSLECRVSIDFPFYDWHELTICYAGNGWEVVDQRVVNSGQNDDNGEAYVEAELSQPTGDSGSLLFGLFDGSGQHLVPPRGIWPNARWRMTRSPLGRWVLGLRRQRMSESTYQVQVFTARFAGLSPPQRDEVRRLFLTVRSHVIAAYLRKASEAERKP